MAVKIKLMRLGKMRAPYYRIVVADARTKREGRVIETIGKYHPKENPSFIEVDGDRAAYWLGVGAQPTEPVAAILKVTGDWQRFKGLPAPAPMLVAEPKVDKKVAFEAAARQSIEGGGGAATTPRKKAAPKATASSTEVDDDTAPAGHAAPPADQPSTATPGTTATPDTADGTGHSATDGPQQSTPAGAAPSAPEAGTGSPQEAGGAADASAAALAADAASSGGPTSDGA
ncbi:MAG: SSU ribosomal protein S16p [uncultured Frankineae bacterium]|uniref:Small ribosomal subunit protein bS16 n=1 Tax=uncultured Frankineae bacterium TaxID=437475 RepID=A0A6J4KUC4_9ACTN|nr:MAG: SSU ribosomal protein S16p [uncultured Frankineae bacterium]